MSNEIRRIKKIYNTLYRQDPDNYAYDWNACNPISIFYRQAQERAFTLLISRLGLKISQLRVLDIGCGAGGFLRFMNSLGVPPKNLHGVDLMTYRIKQAKNCCPPKVDLHVGDGEKLPYPKQSFNFVSQITVFSSILDNQVRQKVAQEMMRVVERHGYILWYDMRRGKSDHTRGLEKDEIKTLFPQCKMKVIWKLHAPYIGHVAKISTLLADILDHVIFFKKTSYLILLQKN